ncbi:MAG: hypothetical protein OEV64_11190 [Desulfobulbaceae bacterium]|nr:hypothetical protein [Desulfobulbaceae bacterium]
MRRAADKRRKARAWMVLIQITSSDLREELGFRSWAQVSETLSGKRNNCTVFSLLRRKGCPDRYLDLPADMKMEEVAA